MIKHLLATTAIVAIATSAYAANATDQQNKPAASAATTQMGAYAPDIAAGDMLASTLIGQTVYNAASMNHAAPMTNGAAPAKPMANQQAQNGQAKNGQPMNSSQQATNQMQDADAQAIGDINDLVVAEDGSVEAVVIGVGGFLGMGEKSVAVPFENLSWSTDSSGKPYVTLATTKEDLQNAPAFDVSIMRNGPAGMDNQAQNAAPAQNTANAPGKMAANPATNAPANAPAANANNNNQPATVDVAKISADELINTTVYDSDNQNVGEVGDVIANQDGKIDAVVVDVGGFLGIGEKPVAIAFEDLDIQKDENNNLVLHTAFTKDQLDSAPKYDKDAYEQQRDTMRLHTQG